MSHVSKQVSNIVGVLSTSRLILTKHNHIFTSLLYLVFLNLIFMHGMNGFYYNISCNIVSRLLEYTWEYWHFSGKRLLQRDLTRVHLSQTQTMLSSLTISGLLFLGHITHLQRQPASLLSRYNCITAMQVYQTSSIIHKMFNCLTQINWFVCISWYLFDWND